MREPLMCSNVITWKCGRASAEILSYASSWCSQCDVECRTALTTGLGQNPPSGQNPPPTKIPIRPNTIADKNSSSGERVRLHVVILYSGKHLIKYLYMRKTIVLNNAHWRVRKTTRSVCIKLTTKSPSFRII